MTTIKIGDHVIGAGKRPFIIAEVAQAHDGSLGLAHSFIDSVAKTGADAIKFQTHIADAESTINEPFRKQMSGQDKTRYDYWKRMEFSEEQWAQLAAHSKEKGLVFLSSAFSIQAVNLLNKIGMPAWKIGSGEFKSFDLFREMLKTNMPMLYSTGMSTYSEIEHTINTFRKNSSPFAIFQCTSNYPTKMENVGLNVIQEYKSAYDCPVGLSDHSGTPWPALAALAQGANLIELHVTFDKDMYGPDTKSSVTMSEMKMICDARDAFFTMQNNPVNKDHALNDMADMRSLFTKSLALLASQSKGAVITEDMLTTKKPGSGIPPVEIKNLVGKKLVKDVPQNRLLQWEDVSDAT